MTTPNQPRSIGRSRPYFSDDDIRAALRLIETAMRSGVLTMGPLGEAFEQRFAQTIGVRHAVAFSSGTAALEVGFRALGVEGREVIVPTETFVASANAVLLAGGRPVFAEVRPETLCLDVDDVARRITSKTAGVLAVHMAGLVQPDFDRLRRLCADRDLFLAEDAAHAHGASLAGVPAGGLGRFGCFSFYPTKVITTGEGGMLTTADDELADLARSYRNHGAARQGSDYVRVSGNYRLPEISAALGLVQVDRLSAFVERRNQIARRYDDAFRGVGGLSLLAVSPEVRHSYWNYILMLDEGLDRAAIARRLGDAYQVAVAWPYEPPCHLQPVFMTTLGTRPGDLPVSERALSRHLAIPMHAALSDEDVDYVSSAVIDTVRAAR